MTTPTIDPARSSWHAHYVRADQLGPGDVIVLTEHDYELGDLVPSVQTVIDAHTVGDDVLFTTDRRSGESTTSIGNTFVLLQPNLRLRR